MTQEEKELLLSLLKKADIEVEETFIYPIFRKMTDALSGEVVAVFKADIYTSF